MDLLTNSVVILVSVLIGYYLGHKPDLKKDGQMIYKMTTQGLQEIIEPKSDLEPGIITRPTAAQLAARKDDEKTKGSKEAMKETLDQMREQGEL